MKYLFIKINERNGEQEYLQHVVRAVNNEENNEEVAKELARTWYDDPDVKVEAYKEEGGVLWRVVDVDGGVIETGFESSADAEDWADDEGYTVQAGEWNEEDKGYHHLGGTIAVSVREVREIPKKHYNILSLYI